jgi:hypothetical protein
MLRKLLIYDDKKKISQLTTYRKANVRHYHCSLNKKGKKSLWFLDMKKTESTSSFGGNNMEYWMRFDGKSAFYSFHFSSPSKPTREARCKKSHFEALNLEAGDLWNGEGISKLMAMANWIKDSTRSFLFIEIYDGSLEANREARRRGTQKSQLLNGRGHRALKKFTTPKMLQFFVAQASPSMPNR